MITYIIGAPLPTFWVHSFVRGVILRATGIWLLAGRASA